MALPSSDQPSFTETVYTNEQIKLPQEKVNFTFSSEIRACFAIVPLPPWIESISQ